MFGIGSTELVIILIFAFLIFGPDKLPAIAKTIGQAIAKFREVRAEMDQVVKEEVYDPAKDTDNPFQRPLDKMAEMDQREVKTETFAERKARHDRERAERQAAEAARNAELDSGEGAAVPQAAAANSPSTADEAPAFASVPAEHTAKPAPKPRPKVSAAELYGTVSKKPAPSAAAPESTAPEGGE